MRVTDSFKYESFKKNIATLQGKITRTSDMLAAQTKILKPSDDPVAAAQVVQLEAQQNTDSQYSRNLNHLQTFGSMYETSLNTVSSALTRAKQLAVTMSSDTVDASIRKAAAEEVKGMIEQLITVGNTKVGNTYIFGGKKSDSAPYVLDEADYSVTFQGSSEVSKMFVANGQTIDAGISGQRIFDSGGASDIFSALKDLKDALESNNTSAIADSIDAIGDSVDLTSNNLSHIGTYMGRLDTLSTTLEAKRTDLTLAVSDLTDVDTVSLYSEYTALTNAYNAALTAMSKLQQLTVLNYLG